MGHGHANAIILYQQDPELAKKKIQDAKKEKANRVENMIGAALMLPQFQGERVISLETYRRNGEPVRTPVWFLEENGILYVHTDDSTGKAKRIRRNAKVRVAPSHFRGKPKAEYIDARAELETRPEIVEKYHRKIYKKYGLQATLTRFVQRFSRSKAKDIIIIIYPT